MPALRFIVALVAVLSLGGCTPSKPTAPVTTPPAPTPAVAKGGAKPRMVQQFGHSSYVWDVALDPSGRWALTTAWDGTTRLWDLQSGVLLRTVGRKRNRDWLSVAITPDGRHGISGHGRHALALWKLASGELVRSYAIPGDSYTAIALSPDGKRLACATGEDGHSLIVVDVSTGKRLHEIEVTTSVSSIAFDPTGERLLVGFPYRIELLELATKEQHELIGNTGALSDDVAMSPDGRFAAATGNQEILIWEMRDPPKLAHSIQTKGGTPNGISFSSDGELLTAVTTSHAYVVELPDGDAKSFAIPPLANNATAAMSADGRHMVVAGGDPSPMVIDVQARRVLYRLPGLDQSLEDVAFTPDGAEIITAGYCGTNRRECRLRIWDANSYALLDRLAEPDDGEHTLGHVIAVSPDGKTAISHASFDLRQWDLPSRKHLRVLADGEELPFDQVRFLPDGEHFVSVGGSMDSPLPSVVLWDLASGKPERVLDQRAGGVSAVAVSSDGKRLATGHQQLVDIYDVASGKRLRTITQKGRVRALAMSPTAPLLASGDGGAVGDEVDDLAPRPHAIHLWNPANGKETGTLAGHDEAVVALTFTHDGKRLVSAGLDLTVRVWDVTSRQLLKSFASEALVSRLVASPTRQQVAAALDDGRLKVWNLSNGAAVTMVADGAEWIAYGDDGSFDASSGGGHLAAAVEGMNGYRIDQLAVRNNRPDKLLQHMGSHDDELIAHYRSRYLRRLRKLGLDAAALERALGAAPQARIAALKHDGEDVVLTVSLRSSAAPLARYNVYVNDVPLYGAVGKPISGVSAELDLRVALSPGKNKIEVAAMNVAGVESLRPVRVVKHDGEPGDLYYLGFGVSKYGDASLDLAFAHKDALDLAKVLEGAGAPFKQVHAHTYVDGQVTTDALRKAKRHLAGAKVNDTVVVFIAGHGTHDQSAEARYFFVTHDTDVERIPQTAAPFELIEDLLQGIAPRQKLLLLDTCESGDRDEAEDQRALTGAKARGLRSRSARALKLVEAGTGPKREAKPSAEPIAIPEKAATGASRSSVRKYLRERNRYIYNDVIRRSGSIVLSSSRGGELSYESEKLHNGIFTEHLLVALTTNRADLDGDGLVSTRELRSFVAASVSEVTGGLQNPTVDRDNIDVRFALPIVKGGDPPSDAEP